MRGFERRTTVDEAVAWVDAQRVPLLEERIPLDAAAGRVLASEITSDVDVPGYDRAMMDGYAVRSAAVAGASPYNPIPLYVVGESRPASGFIGQLTAAEAVRIMTGSPVPAGADAVLPVEQTELSGARLVALGDVSPGKHIGRRGEDVRAGAVVAGAGRTLRPQDLGVLSSVGVRDVAVRSRPRVGIVVTGNEVLEAGSRPEGFKVADANSPMLKALVTRDGGNVVATMLVADDPALINAALDVEADVVLITGGSSVGAEDHAPQILRTRGELAVHGIAMRPSSPAGMGRLGHRLVFLLPGNPVSCLCAYDFFAARAIRRASGMNPAWPYRKVSRTLARKLVSEVGRVDYARVTTSGDQVEPLAVSGAAILSSTTRADGFVVIQEDSEGFPAGHAVDVYLYD
jgi:molybdopterin molybdotransferase